jgi:branched-chain amino acid transport system ATP-binding protein
MLSLGRALAVGPKLLIADEMSLGLAPLVVDLVFDSLEQVRQTGISVLLIEQFVHRALEIADDCVILSRGRVGWTGRAAEAGPELLDRYLGEAASSAV